jgi:hypothetical protein
MPQTLSPGFKNCCENPPIANSRHSFNELGLE